MSDQQITQPSEFQEQLDLFYKNPEDVLTSDFEQSLKNSIFREKAVDVLIEGLTIEVLPLFNQNTQFGNIREEVIKKISKFTHVTETGRLLLLQYFEFQFLKLKLITIKEISEFLNLLGLDTHYSEKNFNFTDKKALQDLITDPTVTFNYLNDVIIPGIKIVTLKKVLTSNKLVRGEDGTPYINKTGFNFENLLLGYAYRIVYVNSNGNMDGLSSDNVLEKLSTTSLSVFRNLLNGIKE